MLKKNRRLLIKIMADHLLNAAWRRDGSVRAIA
jgi:hypothetical protein